MSDFIISVGFTLLFIILLPIAIVILIFEGIFEMLKTILKGLYEYISLLCSTWSDDDFEE